MHIFYSKNAQRCLHWLDTDKAEGIFLLQKPYYFWASRTVCDTFVLPLAIIIRKSSATIDHDTCNFIFNSLSNCISYSQH